jgi:hypothetical protein
MIYFSCYDIPIQDKKILQKSINKERYKHILDNIKFMETEPVKEGKQLRRRKDVCGKEEFNDFKRRSANYSTLRQMPLICKLV